jgi:hypothetical protein
MILLTALQTRILHEANRYAPTIEEVTANERITAAWQVDAQRNPGGPEAVGLADILALRRTFQQLYWCHTHAAPR